MTSLVLIAIAAATTGNFVLVRLLGLCPVLGSPARPAEVAGLTVATTLMLMLTAGLSYLADRWLLAPWHLEFLRILVYLAMVGAAAVLTGALLRGRGARLRARLAPQLPLAGLNCAVLGVALLTAGSLHSLAETLALGFGAGLGFGIVLLALAGLAPRLELAPVPAPLRGPGITLLTLGMLSLAFVGFAGLGS